MAETTAAQEIQPFGVPHWSRETVEEYMHFMHIDNEDQVWEKLG